MQERTSIVVYSLCPIHMQYNQQKWALCQSFVTIAMFFYAISIIDKFRLTGSFIVILYIKQFLKVFSTFQFLSFPKSLLYQLYYRYKIFYLILER